LAGLSTGGGSSAVAASAHAGCDRFRGTDPLITRVSRKALAEKLGFADTRAGIPEARWMRAMTFESLVQSDRFVSELLTKAVGQLGLPRPGGVRRRSGRVSVDVTAKELARAHLKAALADEATMLTALALPFVGLEGRPGATPIKPDFAIVVPRRVDDEVVGSWLVMGDAKDYERVRSRIDDTRMLKGFLQVALGAESAAAWSQLPAEMTVHRFGALAVPRNSFLQPEAAVELLDDYRQEVRARAEERVRVMHALSADRLTDDELPGYVAHIEASFDPATCPTCNLFGFCRNELRTSTDPTAVLAEIGIDPNLRPALHGLTDGSGDVGRVPASLVAHVRATVEGRPQWTGRRRTDPVGLPGSVNVVIAKSDAAALGVYGMAVQSVGPDGAAKWQTRIFAEPQAPQTRLEAMRVIGSVLQAHLDAGVTPLCLVVPDQPTGDVLVSMADSLAGVELSRLRWQRDLDEGRPALTFDGEPATVPDPLPGDARVAVSFLLEQDRSRAMSLRQPIVDLRRVLACHLAAGGPASDSGRLDFLLQWAEASDALDHRTVSDDVADEMHTPGARLSNAESDRIHQAQRGRGSDPALYDAAVRDALAYKMNVVEGASAVLDGLPVSALRAVHRSLERDAQEVWGRRSALQASDLVRFSRTYRAWRNAQVEMLDVDSTCFAQLTALADGQAALDLALDAGNRFVARARVLSVDPIRLDVESRRLTDGSQIVALHVGGEPAIEAVAASVKIQKGSFKLGGLAVGLLSSDAGDGLIWSPNRAPVVMPGDELVVADATWFGKLLTSGHEIGVKRPAADSRAAPTPTCTPSSYAQDPTNHYWCCRPHSAVEAEWSDQLATRRARGELNPQTWPPLIDEDRFDVGETPAADVDPPLPPPGAMTMDDLE
jgi:hypothetical protein